MNIVIGDIQYADVFQNIKWNPRIITGDNSILAVARLLWGGLETELQFTRNNFTVYGEEYCEHDMLVHDADFSHNFHDGVCIMVARGDKNDKYVAAMYQYRNEFANGFKYNEDLSFMIDKTSHTVVFTSVEKNASYIVTTNTIASTKMHKIAAYLSKMISTPTKVDLKSDSNLTEFLKSLYEENEENFAKYSELVCKPFEDERISKMIENAFDGFTSINLDKKAESCKEAIESSRSKISYYYAEIQRVKELIEKYNLEYKIAQNKIANHENDDDKLRELFMSNKNFNLVSYEHGESITVGITGYLDEFNPDDLESCILGQRHDTAYAYAHSDYSFEETKRLYELIFKEHKYKVRTCALWTVDTDGSCRAVSRYSTEMYSFTKNRMPNPHLYYHSCVGDYEEILTEARNGLDFETIFDVIMTSTHTLAFSDSVVISEFANDLTSHYSMCEILEDRNGNLFTPEQVIEEIRKENE